jgi:4-amino-4-deoxy-L-arabinose transferase-like glycosyltransferase
MKTLSRRSALVALSVAFVLICVGIEVFMMHDFTVVNDGDSYQYDALAVSLVQDGTYSLDGTTPFFEREPGYSVFLAGIYRVFGLHAYTAVFALQGLLYLLSVLVFERTMRKVATPRAALLTAAILLLFPAAFHTVFAILRESVSLSLGLIFTACVYEAAERRSMLLSLAAGLLLGLLIITYAALLLIPIFLIVAFVLMRFPWRHAAALFVVMACIVGIWGARNYAHKGELCLTGCYRSALQWYVRGEQAENLRGMEPFACLGAEYLTRDYTGRNPDCHFNAVWHRKWPDGFKGVPEDRQIAKDGQAKILAHFGWYLWGSVAEVLELHLPYVGSLGKTYNLLAAASTAFLYLGCLLALPAVFQRRFALPAAFVLYTIGVFVLTDALPRYLLPVIFCYALAAGIGYDRLLSRFSRHARV